MFVEVLQDLPEGGADSTAADVAVITLVYEHKIPVIIAVLHGHFGTGAISVHPCLARVRSAKASLFFYFKVKMTTTLQMGPDGAEWSGRSGRGVCL